MTKIESLPKPGFISLMQPEDSGRSDAILALGKKLVEELGLETSTDTLGRWMSHYVAELIVQADSSIGDERDAFKTTCFDVILELWSHRAQLPVVGQPFERMRELARNIECLDPDNSSPRYFRSLRSKIAEDEETANVKNWLDLANGLDYSAKILISSCLGNAAHEAKDKLKEWVNLAETAGMEVEGEEMMVRFVERAEDLEVVSGVDKGKIQRLEDRITRLEAFSTLAARFAAELKEQARAMSDMLQEKSV